MDDKRIRPGVWLAVAGALIVLAVVVIVLEARRSARAPQVTAPSQSEPLGSATAPRQAAAPSSEAKPITRTPAAQDEPVPYIEGLVFGDVDLREARELMPDNLYWKLGAPTKDAAVLEEREQEKIRRNQEYGKVLSGDANEDEVRAYYDYRTRLSTDYLEFADFMNRRFGSSLNDQFKGLLELSIKLHTARLAQLPADLEEALARSRERARIREEWRQQQEEFGSAQPDPDEPR